VHNELVAENTAVSSLVWLLLPRKHAK